MKTKFVMSLFLTLFLTQFCMAQNIGIRAGIVNNNIVHKITKVSDNEIAPFEFPKSEVGFFGGFVFLRPISEAFTLRGELLFIQKNFQDFHFTGMDFTRITNNYISVPLLAKINLSNKFHFELGVEPSYWLSTNRRILPIEKFDLSIIAGIAFMIKENIEISGRFNRGATAFADFEITDMNGEEARLVKYFHHNIQLGVGFFFD